MKKIEAPGARWRSPAIAVLLLCLTGVAAGEGDASDDDPLGEVAKANLFLRIAKAGLDSFPEEPTAAIVEELAELAGGNRARWPAEYLMLLGAEKKDIDLAMRGSDLYYDYWTEHSDRYHDIGASLIADEVIQKCTEALVTKKNPGKSARANVVIPRERLERLISYARRPGLSTGFWRLMRYRMSVSYRHPSLPHGRVEEPSEALHLLERSLAETLEAAGLPGRATITEIRWQEDRWLETLIERYEDKRIDRRMIDIVLAGLDLYRERMRALTTDDYLGPLYLSKAVIRLYEGIGEEPPRSFLYYEVIRSMEYVNAQLAEGKTLYEPQDPRPYIRILVEHYDFAPDPDGGTIEQWLHKGRDEAVGRYLELVEKVADGDE